MKGDKLLNEFKGRISGESRRQVQEILQKPGLSDSTDDMKWCMFRKLSLRKLRRQGILKVIAKDKGYALIEKTWYNLQWLNHQCICGNFHILKKETDSYAQESRLPKYYLSGINEDDELYFLHPLFRAPDNAIKEAKWNNNLEPILEWVDRKDEGIDGRIQGDILYKDISYDNIDANLHVRNKFIKLMLERHDAIRSMPPSGYDDYERITNFLSYNNVIQIGNRHKVTILDSVFKAGKIERIGIMESRNIWMAVGTTLVMEHEEHKKVVMPIQENHAILLTIQRGSVDNGKDD